MSVQLARTDKPDPAANEEAVATLTLAVQDRDANRVGRAFFDTAVELALATIPGFFLVAGGSGAARPFGVFEAARVAAEHVPQEVVLLGGATRRVSSEAPVGRVSVEAVPGPAVPVPGGPTRRVPLGSVFGARSGDKGGHANLGVFARSDPAWAWLDHFLGVDELRELLPEVGSLSVDRHALPNLRALNFVIRDLLGAGVASSTRQDAQAKGLGEWLRARWVELPEALLP